MSRNIGEGSQLPCVRCRPRICAAQILNAFKKKFAQQVFQQIVIVHWKMPEEMDIQTYDETRTPTLIGFGICSPEAVGLIPACVRKGILYKRLPKSCLKSH